MDYALLIAEELGLTLEEFEQLRFAGLLHDVGKTGLPQEILLKPGKLTPDEVLEMQRHAEMGATIVEQIDFLKSLTPIILHHHERWDGKGYPMGLVATGIPMLARVLAVADAFDAMTSDRPFRKAMSLAEARRELQEGAGTQFDPRMVAALLEALDRQALAGATGLFAPAEAKGRPDLPM
jgi:putative nucleotidyltransferase with HDIG domain